jgi:hypothetical protein
MFGCPSGVIARSLNAVFFRQPLAEHHKTYANVSAETPDLSGRMSKGLAQRL